MPVCLCMPLRVSTKRLLQILNYSTLAFGDPRGFMTLAGRTLKRKHLLKLYEVFKRHSSSFAKHYFDEITSKFAAVR